MSRSIQVGLVIAALLCAVASGGVMAEEEIPKPPAPILLGDTDDDGFLTVADAIVILRAALGLYEVPSVSGTVSIDRRDVDRDGKISISDAQMVLRQALHLAQPVIIKWVPPKAPIRKVVLKDGLTPDKFVGTPDGGWIMGGCKVSPTGEDLGSLDFHPYAWMFGADSNYGPEYLGDGLGFMYHNWDTGETRVAPYADGIAAARLLERGDDLSGAWPKIVNLRRERMADRLELLEFARDSEGDFIRVKWSEPLPGWEIPELQDKKVETKVGGVQLVSKRVILVRRSIREEYGWYDQLLFLRLNDKGYEEVDRINLTVTPESGYVWRYGVAFLKGYVLIPVVKERQDDGSWDFTGLTLWLPIGKRNATEIDATIYVLGYYVVPGGFWPDAQGHIWQGYDGDPDLSRPNGEVGLAEFDLVEE